LMVFKSVTIAADHDIGQRTKPSCRRLPRISLPTTAYRWPPLDQAVTQVSALLDATHPLVPARPYRTQLSS
jgi:hypothetical protein